jgi:hypothetical protein
VYQLHTLMYSWEYVNGYACYINLKVINYAVQEVSYSCIAFVKVEKENNLLVAYERDLSQFSFSTKTKKHINNGKLAIWMLRNCI